MQKLLPEPFGLGERPLFLPTSRAGSDCPHLTGLAFKLSGFCSAFAWLWGDGLGEGIPQSGSHPGSEQSLGSELGKRGEVGKRLQRHHGERSSLSGVLVWSELPGEGKESPWFSPSW